MQAEGKGAWHIHIKGLHPRSMARGHLEEWQWGVWTCNDETYRQASASQQQYTVRCLLFHADVNAHHHQRHHHP
jgi:hypothetical protein